MKKINFPLFLILLTSFGLPAQIIEFELNTRISNLKPRLELYDSDENENRLEGILEEGGDNIRLEALIANLLLRAGNDVRVFSGNDISLHGDSLTFGRNTSRRTDFTFHHAHSSSNNAGLTIENNGDPNGLNNDNRWAFYSTNASVILRLLANESLVGSFAANGVYTASDKKLKKNIIPLSNVMSGIMALTPSTYDYIKFPNADKKSIGFVAQEVNKHFPELVLDDSGDSDEKVLMLNYAGFGVIAIKAIQEQQEIINTQAKEISLLETQMAELLERVLILEGK